MPTETKKHSPPTPKPQNSSSSQQFISLIEERNYSQKETASILCMSEKSLEKWRFEHNTDLPWIKIGRSVRYFGPDIAAFIERRRIS
ncbi:MerR family transcriptional regulator [Desulfopila aestuarii]|uniref:Helix-turn-helix domain-containing protein n=1 Tax=Desulfopila aestuarii DSM 18488 TaxID=1121416 RepID=A0A1M7YFJ7_9BACT|nr:helix-turn-helix domain-containing protein [Desulfopila aestuarii]SHO51415.1 hypothetical protein SAMN02745220_03995 [Desulfopila aestuarii DSM 18488]